MTSLLHFLWTRVGFAVNVACGSVLLVVCLRVVYACLPEAWQRRLLPPRVRVVPPAPDKRRKRKVRVTAKDLEGKDPDELTDEELKHAIHLANQRKHEQ